MIHRRILLSLTVTLVCLQGFNATQADRPLVRTTIATTNSPNGYYQNFCLALRAVGRQRGVDIECKTGSNGSQENVYQLVGSRNPVDFALVQSDVAQRAWKGEYPFDKAYPDIRLVAPLFTERVHILVGPHQYLTSVAQLKGKRIWIGARGSGSRLSAVAVLQAAGLSFSEVRSAAITKLDGQKAFALLRDQLLDAVIDTKIPNPWVTSAILESLGIKTAYLEISRNRSGAIVHFRNELRTGTEAFGKNKPAANRVEVLTVLLRAELPITSLADLKGRQVQLDKECRHHGAALAAHGLKASSELDTADSFEQLRRGAIDALIEPVELGFDLIGAIMKAGDYNVSPLSADPKDPARKNLGVFTRNDGKLAFNSASDLSQLQGKKVWWDQENQALDETICAAMSGVSMPGQTLDIHPTKDIDTPMAFALLRARELDAVFQTTVAPRPDIADLMNNKADINRPEIRLLRVDWPLVEKLVEDGSYVETSFQRTAYPNVAPGIYTVGVQALLLTALGQKPEDQRKVQALAHLLHDDQDAIEAKLHSLLPDNHSGDLKKPAVLTLLGSPVKPQLAPSIHKAAEEFLVVGGHLRRGEPGEISILIAMMLAVGGAILTLRWKRVLSVRQVSWAVFLLACSALWTVGAIWLQAIEGDVSQDFVNLFAAGTSLGQTVLSHLGLPAAPPAPTTQDGRLAMEIFSWLGALLLGGFFMPFLKKLMNRLGVWAARESDGEPRGGETSVARQSRDGFAVERRKYA